MKTLLLRLGRVDTCRCGETVYWLTHLNGRRAPYTAAGLNHFIDCPIADEFRKGKKTDS